MRNIKDRYVCLYVSPCINFCLSSNFTHPINQIFFTFIFIDKEEKLKKNKDLFGSMDSQMNFEGVHSKGKETLHSIWNEGMFEFLSK